MSYGWQPLRWSPVSLPPGIHTLCTSFVHGLDFMTCFYLRECGRSDGVSLPRLEEDCGVHLGLSPPLRSFVLGEVSSHGEGLRWASNRRSQTSDACSSG